MPKQLIGAVERALTVLATLGSDHKSATLADLAEKTGIHKTTLLRILATLEAYGFCRRLADGRYRLGPELLRLGSFYQETFDLVDYVRPVLAALAEQTGESAALYVPEDHARVCLCRAESPRSIRHYVREGQRLPFARGASGRVLLAFRGERGAIFDSIRRDKVITLGGDRVPEVGAAAAPVFGNGKRLIGALQVSGPVTRVMAAKDYIESVVLEHAGDLTESLGGTRFWLVPEAGECINA